jgi:crossover junction endodeoxyribonuclease RuvC
VICFGIDPGSRRTGWGAVRMDGSRLSQVGCGVIAADLDGSMPDRLREIFDGLEAALAAHSPDVVFLESIFHHKSVRSALVLGQARGVALLAAGGAGRPVGEVSPAEVKKAVTGSGRAEKGQVQEMVRVLLGQERRAQADAADALAIAIAGATRARFDALTGAATLAGRLR